jgi:hypothetical protein
MVGQPAFIVIGGVGCAQSAASTGSPGVLLRIHAKVLEQRDGVALRPETDPAGHGALQVVFEPPVVVHSARQAPPGNRHRQLVPHTDRELDFLFAAGDDLAAAAGVRPQRDVALPLGSGSNTRPAVWCPP